MLLPAPHSESLARRCVRLGLFLVAILPLAGACPAAAGGAGLPEGLERWRPGLERLHSSRTDESLAWFEQRRTERPTEPCGYFFTAFVHLNFDVAGLNPDAETERARELLERGIVVARARMDQKSPAPADRYCAAAIHGLRAQERLQRDKYLGAAYDARRARRLMLDLLDEQPDCMDCRFWVGSYDYFADVLPGLIKFFRSLLFFPPGDKERGLTTLADVAAHGEIERYNALWVLYSLYRGLENDPARAQELLARIRAVYPEAVEGWLVEGWSHVGARRPGDPARNIAAHERALEHFARLEGATGERVRRRIEDSLARAHLNDLRAERAVELLARLWPEVRGDEERELGAATLMARALNHAGRHADAVELLGEMRERHADAPELERMQRTVQTFDAASSSAFVAVAAAWRSGRQELERGEATFATLLASDTPPGIVHFAMGSMFFDAGRDEDALREFREATRAGLDSPTTFAPLAWLRIGNLLDVAGDRREAKRAYRRASDVAGEHEWAKGAAKFYLERPHDGTGGVRFP